MNSLTFNYRGFTQNALAEHKHLYHKDKKRISTKPLLKYVTVDFFWFAFGCQNEIYIRDRDVSLIYFGKFKCILVKITLVTELHIQNPTDTCLIMYLNIFLKILQVKYAVERYRWSPFSSHFPAAVEFLTAAAVRTEWAGRHKSQHIIRTLTDFSGTHSIEHLNNALSRKWIMYFAFLKWNATPI